MTDNNNGHGQRPRPTTNTQELILITQTLKVLYNIPEDIRSQNYYALTNELQARQIELIEKLKP